MISILYVDDEPDLLDLAKLFLEQASDMHVDTSTSAADALASPAIGSYNVIISDYQMPGMDGIAFLKAVRASFGTLPFILFTGRGREEIVIEAINNGADFYLQKGGDVKSQFAELAHKIRQADARKKTESRLIDSEKRLSDIINFLPDATFAISREGTIIAWNRAIEEMTGRTATEMLGKGDYEYALPFYGERRPILIDLVSRTDDEILQSYSNLSREGPSITAETDLPHPKGTRITVLAKASPLYNRQGELTGAIESIRDITERNRSQDELKAAYEQITASEEELREQVEALTVSERKVRENAARIRYMLGFYERAGGDEKALLDYAVEGAGFITGSPLGYLAFLNDDESELSMYAWSKSAMDECRLRDKPIVYKTEKTGLWGEAVRQRRPVITNDYASPNPAKKGYPEGHPVIFRHMNVPVIDGGRIVIVAGVANKQEDYTEEDIRQLSVLMHGLWQVLRQRRTKDALFESEQKYRDLFENSVIGIFRTTPEGKFSAINTKFAHIAGYDSPQQMMEAIRDVRTQLYVNAADQDRFTNTLATEGFVRDFEARYYHQDGHQVWILINATTVRDPQGNVLYYEGTIEDITEKKKIEEALARERTFSDAVIDSIPGLLYMYDSSGKLVRWNKAHETVTGYSAEELAGRDVLSWFRGDDISLQAVREGVARAFRDGFGSAEGEVRTRDGRKIPFFFTAQRLEIEGETYITGVGIDITERRKAQDELLAAYEQITASEEELRGQLEILAESEKKARESETRFRAIFDKSHDALVLSDERTLLDCNMKMLEMFGYDSVEEMRRLLSSDASPEVQPDGTDSRAAALAHLKAAAEKGEERFEWVHKRKDGTTFPAEVFISIFDIEGKTYFQTSIRDISERKAAEVAIRESEERYRNVIEFSPLGMHFYELRPDGALVFAGANPAADRILGIENSRFIGMTIEEAFPGLASTEVPERYRSIARDGMVWHTDQVIYERDEIRGAYTVHAFRIRPGAMAAVFADITELKRSEEALRKKTEELDLYFTTSLDLFCIADTDGYFRRLNPEWERALGYTLADLEGKRFLDFIHPDDLQPTLDTIGRLKGQEEILNFTNRYRHKDGSYRWIEWRSHPVGNLIYAAARDVTNRKEAEASIRRSEELYRSILDNIQDVYYRSDAGGNLIMISPSALPLLGYDSVDEILGRNIGRDLWFSPDDRQALMDRIQKDGSVKNYEVVLKRKDGTAVTVATSSHRYFDRDGNPAGVEGTFHDVTAIREADEQIRVLAGLIEISPASVSVHDPEGRFIYANQRTFDLHGYPRDEFMKLNVRDLDVPVSAALYAGRIDELKTKGETAFDVEHYHRDGSKIPLHINAKLARWKDRDVILSVATDISERMSAEKILFESEERLQLALAGADLGTWNWDIPTGRVVFNERWAEMIGYRIEEIEPRISSWEQLVHPDDLSHVRELLSMHLEGKTEAYECEHRLLHKNGSWIWVLDRGRVIDRDDNGNPLMAAGTHLDITQRKKAESALKESEQRYRSVIENIQDGFFRINRDGRIIMASPSAARMFGYSHSGDILGHRIDNFFRDEEVRKTLNDRITRDGSIQDMMLELKRRDGTMFWGSVNAHHLIDAEGRPAGIEGSIHDVTEYRVMEQAIREANRKITLLNSITRHDVTNQLTALHGFIQIASMIKTDPAVREYLEKIRRVADTITRQIEFTRTYQELAAKDPAWFRIEEMVASAESTIPVRFSGTCRGVEVFADPMIGRVFFNLFDNAARHGGTVTAITVRCEREPDGMIVIVEDNGTGIPLTEKEKIFTRGYGKNTGLGLFLAKEILAITGIGIRETGIPGEGARFEILVPGVSVRTVH